jgi:hypothetical protein
MQPSILRNTLLSESGVDHILSQPRENDTYAAILAILKKFQDMRKFASEIHTEIHLVKPILKLLGYAYESKPKFFEDQVKGPDVALFAAEEERTKCSQIWGTEEYYTHALGILLLKRYGRNLKEGITGFYLEFENRIPVYQTLYLLKKTKTPWAVLTNGKHWILFRRPLQFEERSIEIDVETALSDDPDALHLFYHIFSLKGLTDVVPDTMEDERKELIESLQGKRTAIQRSIQGLKKKVDIYPRIAATYRELFPEEPLPYTEVYLKENDVEFQSGAHERPRNLNGYNMGDIFSYLFLTKTRVPLLNLEEIILEGKEKTGYTKEDLLSIRVLDMTPGFGTLTVQILEGLAYMSFVLPYRERNTFVAEWEEEKALKKHISDYILYGIERSPVSLDILRNTLRGRNLGTTTVHYKLGNPLIGMSLKDISVSPDAKNQMTLFNKPPKDVVKEFKEMYRLYLSLSARIKENMQIKNELEVKLSVYTERIRDLMDLMTATYFTKTVDQKKVQDALFGLDSDESYWDVLRKKEWFLSAKALAKRNGFFHFELEFPFLLNSAFDFIIAQPELSYLWEGDAPPVEATKAFIMRGMTYLKPRGRMVIILANPDANLVSEIKKSKKYDVDPKNGFLLLKKKQP